MRDNELVPVKRLFGHKFLAKRELDKLRKSTKPEEEEEEKAAEGKGRDEEGEGEQNEKAGTALSNERLAILCAVFHPTQPWLFTSGADGQIALFTY
uniref:WD_REPEATS_REGION domain-containing protein n=1 Tax=Globodera pallida TaxID=36090 RepID=A0A183C3Z5_GLOPA